MWCQSDPICDRPRLPPLSGKVLEQNSLCDPQLNLDPGSDVTGEEPLHKTRPLDTQTDQKKVEADGAVAVVLQESQEETHADEFHDADRLEI